MGWETRGNKEYYYGKERYGSKVVSRYLGSTDKAQKMVEILEAIREEKRKVRERESQIDKQIEAGNRLIKSLADGMYLIAGYYQHKGGWRKLRRSCDEQKTK